MEHHHGLGPEAHGVHEVGLELEVRIAPSRMSGSTEFRTMYWPGWVDRRMSARWASRPISASSGAHASTCPRNWGRSGWVA
jgi:hypothetical protein